MTLLVADISSHNVVLDWTAFLNSVDGLIVKISEGIGYTWSGAATALGRARAAGKCVGAYHFARVNDPVAEANYFLANYSHQPGEVIVLDWEPGTNFGDRDDWAYAWCQRVIAATGVVPMLYLNHYYAAVQSQWPRTRSLGCGLWAAWYGANTGTPQPGMPSFAPWPSPAMWQFTSNGTRPGVSGVIDLSEFYGDADQWRAYGTAGANPGGFLMALNDQQQLDVYNAIMGMNRVLGEAWDPNTGTGIGARVVAIQQAVSQAQDPTALANAVVTAMGTEFAQKVIDALGQRINATQPPAA